MWPTECHFEISSSYSMHVYHSLFDTYCTHWTRFFYSAPAYHSLALFFTILFLDIHNCFDGNCYFARVKFVMLCCFLRRVENNFRFVFYTFDETIVNRWKEHLFDSNLNETARGKLKVYVMWQNPSVLLDCIFIISSILYLKCFFFQSTQYLFASPCMHEELCRGTPLSIQLNNKSLEVTIEQLNNIIGSMAASLSLSLCE